MSASAKICAGNLKKFGGLVARGRHPNIVPGYSGKASRARKGPPIVPEDFMRTPGPQKFSARIVWSRRDQNFPVEILRALQNFFRSVEVHDALKFS